MYIIKTKRGAYKMSSTKKSFHVIRLGKGWSVKSNKRVLSSYDTREKALCGAIIRAKRAKAGVVIHDWDGRIRSKHSYDGNDLFPPIG